MLSSVDKVPPGTSSESAWKQVTTVGGPQVVHTHTLSKAEFPPVQELVGARPNLVQKYSFHRYRYIII